MGRERLCRYELLDPPSAGLYAHECFLKAAYVGCTAAATDPMAGYGTWTSSDPGWVGHSGPEVCYPSPLAVPDRSCLLVGMDYGGSPHSCGYATIIVIYSDTPAFPAPGWYSGAVAYNTLLTSAGACQDLCSATPGCDYFAYEWEETAGSRHHECYLKQGYSYNECPHPVMEQYVPWSNAADPAWHGVSGPAVCVPPPPPPPPCIYASMDYGRSSSPCGAELGGVYADTVALHYDNVLYDVPGWLSAPTYMNPVLSSEVQCQILCAAHSNCSYFSYE